MLVVTWSRRIHFCGFCFDTSVAVVSFLNYKLIGCVRSLVSGQSMVSQ